MRGVFISFEGSEGCGKSTQISRLEERLQVLGQPFLHVREPGGTEAGEHVRHLLKEVPDLDLAPEAELLLFTASRAQLVREKLIPALDAGTHVIADRFLDSTTVYQGVARGLSAESVSSINRFAVGGCLPAVTFLLDMDSKAGRERALARQGGVPDRMESEGDAFYERVRQGYLDLARKEPERFAVVDADQSEECVADSIWATLTSRFHGVFS